MKWVRKGREKVKKLEKRKNWRSDVGEEGKMKERKKGKKEESEEGE